MLTQQTIALIQVRLGIKADGVLGPKTFEALKAQGLELSVREHPSPEFWARLGLELETDDFGNPDWSLESQVEAGVDGSFVPIGVMVHHTAGPRGRVTFSLDALKMFRVGRPDLAGPLANVFIDRCGQAFWMTNGRANHAGAGSSRVLEAVRVDRPTLPRPDPDDTYGNSHFFGIELDNCGHDEPYPKVQIDTAVRIVACWCRAFKWNPLTRVIGHEEWTRRKTDPSYSMADFRAAVAKHLQGEGPVASEIDRIAALEVRIAALEAKG
jgi:hypothetical protein